MSGLGYVGGASTLEHFFSVTLRCICLTYPCGFLQTYSITFTKKQIPRYVQLTDAKLAMKYEDPISLSPIYQPISIRGSDPKNSFSAPFIDEMTKTSKFNPLTEEAFMPDWRIEDYALDSDISRVVGYFPTAEGGKSTGLKLIPEERSQQNALKNHLEFDVRPTQDWETY